MMQFEIIGSGGCVSLPKPLCKCSICAEAREKGRPYSRYGCALFLHDLNLLIDTPEDIVHAVNDSGIDKIDRVLFSHGDPDHVLGFRLFEQLRLNWFDVFEGRECTTPIEVMAMPHVMADLNAIRSKQGSYFDYYEGVRRLIQTRTVEKSISVENIEITFVRTDSATVFVFSDGISKVIYAPCDVKPFPESELFMGADLMIIGNTIIGEVLKGGYVVADDNPLRADLFSMDEIEALKSRYAIKEVIMTHLEEDWGKSYADYCALEKTYEGIRFAYDGMVINP